MWMFVVVDINGLRLHVECLRFRRVVFSLLDSVSSLLSDLDRCTHRSHIRHLQSLCSFSNDDVLTKVVCIEVSDYDYVECVVSIHGRHR